MFQTWETEPRAEQFGDAKTIEDAADLINQRSGNDMSRLRPTAPIRLAAGGGSRACDAEGVPVAWASYLAGPVHSV